MVDSEAPRASAISGTVNPPNKRSLATSAFSGSSLSSLSSASFKSIISSARTLCGVLEITESNFEPLATATGGELPSRVVDEDAPHGLSRRRIKMLSSVPFQGSTLRLNQLDPRFMHQRGRLQSVPRPLARHLRGRQLTQFPVDQGQKLSGRFRLSNSQRFQDARDLRHTRQITKFLGKGKENPSSPPPLATPQPDRIGEWKTKPAKRALEYLLIQGNLMVPQRVNFHKVYDLNVKAELLTEIYDLTR